MFSPHSCNRRTFTAQNKQKYLSLFVAGGEASCSLQYVWREACYRWRHNRRAGEGGGGRVTLSVLQCHGWYARTSRWRDDRPGPFLSLLNKEQKSIFQGQLTLRLEGELRFGVRVTSTSSPMFADEKKWSCVCSHALHMDTFTQTQNTQCTAAYATFPGIHGWAEGDTCVYLQLSDCGLRLLKKKKSAIIYPEVLQGDMLQPRAGFLLGEAS